uniref:Uncharacterized protein n=1 Tax=Syphacia muris TaxID=451379 RepID=A0A0N5AAP4_9BILA
MFGGFRGKLELFRFATLMTTPIFMFWLYSFFEDSYKEKYDKMLENMPLSKKTGGSALQQYFEELDDKRSKKLLEAKKKLLGEASARDE